MNVCIHMTITVTLTISTKYVNKTTVHWQTICNDKYKILPLDSEAGQAWEQQHKDIQSQSTERITFIRKNAKAMIKNNI